MKAPVHIEWIKGVVSQPTKAPSKVDFNGDTMNLPFKKKQRDPVQVPTQPNSTNNRSSMGKSSFLSFDF